MIAGWLASSGLAFGAWRDETSTALPNAHRRGRRTCSEDITMAMKVRAATVDDSLALASLSSQLGYGASVHEVESRLRGLEAAAEHRVLVACLEGGAQIGWIHVFIALRVESGPFGEIGGFVVAEGHRRTGIGSSLLGHAEEWLKARGIESLRVRSRASRLEAHAFFERSGFSMTKDQRIFDKRIVHDI